MALDLYFLDQTIKNDNILFTLRFYLWEGYWLSIGYHQKNLPPHWIELADKGLIHIIRRPSGGGAVLHSGGITYAITFKKLSYKKFSYSIANNWLIRSFEELGISLKTGHIKRTLLKNNCFGSSYTSDLIDKDGYKRIGSAQYWKKGSFLQHGEIQICPPNDLWASIFNEESPPFLKLKLNHHELINYLTDSFLANHSNLNLERITLNKKNIDEYLN
mgnify:CR=1 FL=1